MNALKELLDYLESFDMDESDIERIAVKYYPNGYNDEHTTIITDIQELDLEYDDGYGLQYIDGYVLLRNGDWLERYEYDGSESWAMKSRPSDEWLDEWIKEED